MERPTVDRTPRPSEGSTVELTTRFTRAYGLTKPIVQAGMAFAGTTPDLAVAVSNAGALGSLGVGLMPARVLKQTLAAIRSRTARRFNVNSLTRSRSIRSRRRV
jgi:enoyl-[acyl-carrier protein] reductase II